jgi:hypothetical protein
MKPELRKESKRQQRQLDTSARRGSSLEEKIYVIRVVHAVENMFIAFLPHIPPRIPAAFLLCPTLAYATFCSNHSIGSWHGRQEIAFPCKLNHNQMKDVVDELMFCILRL